MAPNKISIMRTILAEVPLVCKIDMESYAIENKYVHSRLMKADPQGTTEAYTNYAHMTRLLDGLSDDQHVNMNYLLSSWEDLQQNYRKGPIQGRSQKS